MKKMKFIFTLLFVVSLSLNAQTKKQELKLKKGISKFVKKVKNIDDRDKKEKVLEAFVSKLEEINNKSETKGVSKKEKEEFNKTLDVIVNGFDMVEGGTKESLNSYADYLESEFNQASDFTDVLILIGPSILLLILIIIIL
jgi:hypothetical protein